MTQYLSQQRLLALLLAAFCFGIAIGAVYQVFLIRRAAFEQMRVHRIVSVLWLNAEDFLFLVAIGCCVAVLFFAMSNGVLRLMAFPAMGCGVLLWRLTLGRLIGICTQRILCGIAWVLHRLKERILRPLWRRLSGALRRLWRRIADCHQRFKDRRLWAMAKKETERYTRSLTRAMAMGNFPHPKTSKTINIKDQAK